MEHRYFCLKCNDVECDSYLCAECWRDFPQAVWSEEMWQKLRIYPIQIEKVVQLFPQIANSEKGQWVLGIVYTHLRAKLFVTILLCVKKSGITLGKDLSTLLGKYLITMVTHVCFIANGYQIVISRVPNGKFFFCSAARRIKN